MEILKTNMSLLNDLSEFITIRIRSYFLRDHDAQWIEHKTHVDYDLWFIQSGKAYITINGIEHVANAGDAVFFYPGVPYTASTSEEGCHFIYIHFDFGIGQQQRILNDFQLSGIIRQNLIKAEAQLFEKTFHQTNQSGSMPENRLYLKACLTIVLAKIIELHEKGLYTGTFSNEKKPKKTEKNLNALQPVFKYVNSHLDTSIKMNQLASLIGISEKYFIAYFKKNLGITPGQYIYQIKMNRAREYLHAKQYSIQQISSLLGYSDPFTFSKAFKKYYHVPPSKFE